MANPGQTYQDIKELQVSLRALEKSLLEIAQKLDSQFQQLKKLILLNLTTRSTADSKPSAQLSSEVADSTAEITHFDGSTEDEHHRVPNSPFISEEEGRSNNLPPPPSPPPTWKYDVFVSFRGKDTRKGFVSHLFEAFKREGVNCYRDVDGNERGQKVNSMLIDAIRHSKMAIVLLSENYADSKWCLQELVEILSWNNQQRIHSHMVLPIFYDVSSSDVRHLGGMVGKAFLRCIAKNGQHNKDIWHNALKQVGTISSWTSNNGDEASIVKEIVEVLLKRVAYSRSSDLVKSSIVPNDNLIHLRSILDMTSNDVVRTVGICGTEGIGKTTLANAACIDLHKVFEGRVILIEDIDAMKTLQDLLEIQSKITVKLLKDKWLRLSEDTNKNIQEIRMRLSKKKVLIVLDNVTTLEQVELVLGKDYEKFLFPGSRVVITSRDWGLLDELNVDNIYMVPPLNHEDSLKLFYHYAFMGRQDIKSNEELSKNIVYYAAGIPSVLESLGYFLSNSSETQWYEKLHDLVRCSSSLGDTKLYQCGPFESSGWNKLGWWDDGQHGDVRGIELVIVDSVIKSISVTYDNYGHPVGPLFHGCSSSSSRTVLPLKIELDYPYEYLMSISGYKGKTERSKVTISSLTLHSNKRTFGPFGDESKSGQHFYTHPAGVKIVGFYGAGDSELQYIGVHAKQVSHTYPHHQIVGPFGKIAGVDWDHGAFTDIRKIIITHDNCRHVISISCVYDYNGLPVEILSQHSQSSTYQQVEVTLNYPTEFILSMSGCYEHDNDNASSYVTSLTFQTNLKMYGPYPYGTGEGLKFSTPLKLGKIVGFYGTRVSVFGQSIGAYFAPVFHMQPLMTIEPFGGVFSDTWDDGKHSGVKRIYLNLSDSQGILNLRFMYADGNGGTVKGRNLGFPGSVRALLFLTGSKKVIELDYPKEYLVSISGLIRGSSEIDYIGSLSFETNLKEYGPYGYEVNECSKPFSFKSNIAKIVGFHGTVDLYRIGKPYTIGPHLQLL